MASGVAQGHDRLVSSLREPQHSPPPVWFLSGPRKALPQPETPCYK